VNQRLLYDLGILVGCVGGRDLEAMSATGRVLGAANFLPEFRWPACSFDTEVEQLELEKLNNTIT